MAGGIDWFRWHHGSITDPKFQLIAQRAGVRLGDVMVVWTFVLETASASPERGTFGELDFETLDFLLGMDGGTAERILAEMVQRRLVIATDATSCNENSVACNESRVAYRVARWGTRQVKREREAPSIDADATERPLHKSSTDRSRERRARLAEAETEQRHATPCIAEATPHDASNEQITPREEKRREEEIKTPPLSPKGESAGFTTFWGLWPRSDRKQSRGKCLAAWRKERCESVAEVILAHVSHLVKSESWTKDRGRYVPAPLVYLNQRRWEGAESAESAGLQLVGAV
jgi:hypothetical protein